jgi:outer membrane protein insertion porin family
MSLFNFNLKVIIFILVLNLNAFSEIVENIQINGNQRISNDTIKIFSNIDIGDEINKEDINRILKDLYETNFFENVNIKFLNNILNISVSEHPIIQNVTYEGVKSKSLLSKIEENKLIREKASFNEFILSNEEKRILTILRNLGYYNSILDTSIEKLDNNTVSINFKLDIGKKAKIKKITFIGDKKFKDSKLKRLIISSEYKFWKFLSGKKYLNENVIKLDERLLKNYYLNNGYYNVIVNSSFAKLIGDNEFELIFNINAQNKFFFGDLKLDLPNDFDTDNFKDLNKLLVKIKGEKYSLNLIDKILDEIDQITTIEEFKFIKATVKENVISDKVNLVFKISESEKVYVEKINIMGNTVTQENVIRNQFELDEGDPFNEILFNKSINNLKSLGFFKSVNEKVLKGKNVDTKIINISVEEKATGEITASAGVGTSGGSIGFGVKENNFMGRGISLDSNVLISGDSLKGKFGLTNPNYKNSDKSFYMNAEILETDNFKTFGYKSNKKGINVGTKFEYLDDFYIGIGTSNFYEVIETNSTASKSQQSQEGNYWDSFLNLDFNYDKRNQKFQTTDGFRSFYSIDLPIISDNETLKNYYSYSQYFELFDQNISSFSLMLNSAKSISNKDIKLSERINIPSSRLRGFESGRIGPKDGDDYIGGNYGVAINFASTIPQILEQSQNVDFLFFIDAANLWGVDYDNSLDDSGSIRSSLGLALDWYSPIGPLNFSLAYPITKEDSDKEETFRFNLGTTF